ncbi:MAG: Gfo/Idh/MocA family oxidoreductase [Verrucomicrobia bacterium]|nr:Gfo/Idh/MocA family oxidoreductase [Verrucomicrobiota bacterium]
MNHKHDVSRRQFIGGTLAASSILGTLAAHAEDNPAAAVLAKIERKIKIGVVGLGGRGNWLAGLIRNHGGYEIHAVADYFPNVAEQNGTALGVDKARCFSGLSGYKKVIASGIEAIIIIDVPYFYPEQAKAAVDAGLHIYMAKPVCVDVPGALSIGESGKVATQKKRVLLVDYQMPTDPLNIEVYKRIAAGGLGKLQTIFSNGAAGGGGFNDPPLTKTIESRLQGLTWVSDDELGCGYIGNYDIHVVDAVMRAIGGRVPVAAYGWGARYRPEPHGNALDTTCVMYTFEDGTVWNHQSPKGTTDDWFAGNGSLVAEFQGSEASARVSYWGKAYVRGGPQAYSGGKIENLYDAGAVRNIASFYDAVIKGETSNPTVKQAVDSALVCILGREAAMRRTPLTMLQLLKDNKKLEVDLTGLKA